MPTIAIQPSGSDKREAILAAALSLFARNGFHGTAVPEIGARAKVGAGTIYRNFESKEGLVNALYQRTKRHLLHELLTDFPFQSAPRAQFRAFFFRLLGFARRHPDAFAFLEHHHHADYLDAESLKLERESLAPILHFMDEGKCQGELKALPSEVLVAIVWSVAAGLVKAAALGHVRFTDELVADAEVCAWDAIALKHG